MTTLKSFIEEPPKPFSTSVRKPSVESQLKELKDCIRTRNFQRLYEVAIQLASRIQREHLGSETTYNVLEALFILKNAGFDTEKYIEELLHI
jgi:hypothetical protein